MSKPKKSIQETVQKEMPEFAAEVAELSVDELDFRLAQNAKDTEGVEQAKDEDLSLEEARALASELAQPYREAKKALGLKSKYIISLIKEKGGEV